MLFIKCVLIFLILKMKAKVIGKLESDEVDTGFQPPKRRQQNYFFSNQKNFLIKSDFLKVNTFARCKAALCII